MFSSKDLFFTPAVSTGYTVSKSLRFRSGSSTYLNRTFSGSPTTFTFSFWIKRGILATQQLIACARYNGNASASFIDFTSSDTLRVLLSNNTSSTSITTTAIFKDPSAWYHIVVSSTAGGTAYIYVNGTQYASGSVPSGYWLFNNGANVVNTISRYGDSASLYFDGYLAETYFIDGSALLPSSFGAYDSNGIWQPAAYTGSYGTNGFYLQYTDVGATSGSNAGYGKDFSGNGNYWTTNNFGTTSTGTSAPSYDSMLDSPTNATGDIGNYCVLNPLSGLTGTLSEANLYYYGPTGWAMRTGTLALPSSSKIYFEATLTVAPFTPRGSTTSYNYVGVGLATNFNITGNSPSVNNVNSCVVGDGGYLNNFASSASDAGVTFVNGDVIGVAIDTGANTYAFYKNGGTAFASGTINVTSGTQLVPIVFSYDNSYGAPKLNFGQRPFIHNPPSGYSPLTTQNLPTPTITNGAQYMAAVIWTGNSSSTGNARTITTTSSNSGNNPNGTTFQPDFVWVKNRSNAYFHNLYDAVRGSGSSKNLQSNTTNAEGSDASLYGYVSAFNSDGFQVTNGTDASFAGIWVNQNTQTFVGWQWNAGGSNATNTSGSITSTVRANTTAGFSIVTWTGTGATGTIGHGLGATPSFIIVKARSASGEEWYCYHVSLGATARIQLNSTAAQTTGSSVWNSTSPTSTVFSIGSGNPNTSLATYVAYCFAPVSGYSAFGSYTGNGSTDGPFIYLGFRPRWIMIKCTSTSSVPSYDSWKIIDTSRSPYNAANPPALWANASYEEGLRGNGSANSATLYENILSNGFKLGTGSSYEVETNESGETYIYAAFAENPFKISRAR